MLNREYIPKDYVLFIIEYYGNMLTWNKDSILAEIKNAIEKEKGKTLTELKETIVDQTERNAKHEP